MIDGQEVGNIIGAAVLFAVFTVILIAFCYCICAGFCIRIRDWYHSRNMALPVYLPVNDH